MVRSRLVLAGLALLGAAGCTIDPRDYETTPVEVASSKGVVTCQLYIEDTIVWDRAIDIPNGMSIAEGDQICRAEGQRRLES